MSESCTLVSTSGKQSESGDGSTYRYLAIFDTLIVNPHQAISAARSLTPNPVPQRRQPMGLGTFLYAQEFSATRTTEKELTAWLIEVDFLPPNTEKGENETHQISNPIDRPPIVRVDPISRQYVIKKAKNVTELTGGFTRPSGTEGPIVNAAFRRPDEPPMDTENSAVITARKNFADAGDVFRINRDYKRTTNSDTVTIYGVDYGPRTLKFFATTYDGFEAEEGVGFHVGTSEFEVLDTTDISIDNVGYEYWDAAKADYVRALDADGNPTAEPVNLELDGTRKPVAVLGDTGPTSIVYRHLEAVPYSQFFV